MPQGDGTGKFERTPEMRQQARDKSLAAIARRKAAIAAGENPADKIMAPAPEPYVPPRVVIGEIIMPVYRGGTHPKLNNRTAEIICAFLVEGNYADTAAQAAGITYPTYREWLRKGEYAAEGDPYRVFYDAVVQAKALGEARLLQIIREAAQKPHLWTAASWILERTMPHKYGRVNRVELLTRQQIEERAAEENLDPDIIEATAIRLALAAGGDNEGDE